MRDGAATTTTTVGQKKKTRIHPRQVLLLPIPGCAAAMDVRSFISVVEYIVTTRSVELDDDNDVVVVLDGGGGAVI